MPCCMLFSVFLVFYLLLVYLAWASKSSSDFGYIGWMPNEIPPTKAPIKCTLCERELYSRYYIKGYDDLCYECWKKIKEKPRIAIIEFEEIPYK